MLRTSAGQNNLPHGTPLNIDIDFVVNATPPLKRISAIVVVMIPFCFDWRTP
jgi:hypothetical protein